VTGHFTEVYLAEWNFGHDRHQFGFPIAIQSKVSVGPTQFTVKLDEDLADNLTPPGVVSSKNDYRRRRGEGCRK
jgi:hypothetical protein